jgi:hypothetical protein
MHDRLAQVGLDTATLPRTAQLHLFRIILAVLIVIGVVTGVRGYGNSIFSKTELNLSETREQSILNRLPKDKARRSRIIGSWPFVYRQSASPRRRTTGMLPK